MLFLAIGLIVREIRLQGGGPDVVFVNNVEKMGWVVETPKN